MEARTPAVTSALADYAFWLILAAEAIASLRRARANAEAAFLGAERVCGWTIVDRATALVHLTASIDPPLGDLPARAFAHRHAPPFARFAREVGRNVRPGGAA